MTRLALREVFGLSPLGVRLAEAYVALAGRGDLPKTRYDTTSLTIFHPGLGLRTWLGLRRQDRRVPVVNLFNHTPTPPSEGWSVRRTQVRDFRGGTLSYDSHNGTDFGVPLGTTVVAPAPGKVLRVSSEFNRGGLKVFIDHGGGLVSSSNHLGRALVAPGELVRRGQPVALSAYSGIDGVITFPWGVPHIHFNVWLDGVHVDPFGAEGEAPLWREGNDPRPARDGEPEEAYVPTDWDEAALGEAIAAAKDAEARAEIEREPTLERRAHAAQFLMSYYPTRFTHRPRLAKNVRARGPILTLPVSAADFDGIVFAG